MLVCSAERSCIALLLSARLAPATEDMTALPTVTLLTRNRGESYTRVTRVPTVSCTTMSQTRQFRSTGRLFAFGPSCVASGRNTVVCVADDGDAYLGFFFLGAGLNGCDEGAHLLL